MPKRASLPTRAFRDGRLWSSIMWESPGHKAISKPATVGLRWEWNETAASHGVLRVTVPSLPPTTIAKTSVFAAGFGTIHRRGSVATQARERTCCFSRPATSVGQLAFTGRSHVQQQFWNIFTLATFCIPGRFTFLVYSECDLSCRSVCVSV